MKTQAELAEQTIRLMTQLPIGVDKDLILLKGHLLIEDLLIEILKTSLENDNPTDIDVDKITLFDSILNLCWALNKSNLPVLIWESIKELNSIRNYMANNVPSAETDQRIADLSSKILSNSGFCPDSYQGCELECSIAWLQVQLKVYLQNNENPEPTNLPEETTESIDIDDDYQNLSPPDTFTAEEE